MLYKLVVPGPIEDVEEVRILEWHAAPGRAFQLGELIVELETHKALVEVRAGQLGVLRKIICAEGDWQALGEPLAIFGDSLDEAVPEPADVSAELLVEFEVS